jgi:cytoskeletal protein RodZ
MYATLTTPLTVAGLTEAQLAIGVAAVALVAAGLAIYRVQDIDTNEQPDDSTDLKQAISQLSTEVERIGRDLDALQNRVDQRTESGSTDDTETGTQQSPPSPDTSTEPEQTAGEPETSKIVDEEEEDSGPGINKIDIDDEY